jgi:hypothetical protein
MSKAYDRVEWMFPEKMMQRMGFTPRWVNQIMKCVQTVTYRVKINGRLSEAFKPERGLRQGDPLSPYLFILCAEAFSAMLQHAEVNGTLEGIQLCPTAPRVNHLFFADDSLIVMKAKVGCA